MRTAAIPVPYKNLDVNITFILKQQQQSMMKSSPYYEDYKDRATKIIQQTIYYYDKDNKDLNNKTNKKCLENDYNLDQSRPPIASLPKLCHRDFIVIDADPNRYIDRLILLTLDKFPQKEDRPTIIRLLDDNVPHKTPLKYRLYDSINLYYNSQFSIYL